MKYDKSDQKKIYLFLFVIGIICVILVLQQKAMARNPPISVYPGNVPDNDAEPHPEANKIRRSNFMAAKNLE